MSTIKNKALIYNNWTSGCHFCTVKHGNCWGWETRGIFFSGAGVVFFWGGGGNKIQVLLRDGSVTMLVWTEIFRCFFWEASQVYLLECINPLISSIYTHFLQTGINTKHTLLSYEQISLEWGWWEISDCDLFDLRGLQFNLHIFLLWKGH